MDSMERQWPLGLAARCGLVAIVTCGIVACGRDSRTQGISRADVDTPPAAQPSAHFPKALQAIDGLACKPVTNDIWNCSAPGYDISGSDVACDAQSASFGRIVASDVLLSRTMSTEVDSTARRLSTGQWVCVQYTAESNKGARGWLYVTAIPTALVPGCSAARDCAPSPEAPGSSACRVHDSGRYTSSCPSGWLADDTVTVHSMGLDGQFAEATPANDAALETPKPTQDAADFQRYSASPMGAGECVAGARLDDLGQQQAVVMGRGSDGRQRWSTDVPRGPQFYENRATHCACREDASYVAVATDTQPAQSLSQTLLSIVKIDAATGELLATRTVDRIPSAPGARSIWMDSPDTLIVSGAVIELRGRWRVSADDAPETFRYAMPLF
jgi:hypothetical protein